MQLLYWYWLTILLLGIRSAEFNFLVRELRSTKRLLQEKKKWMRESSVSEHSGHRAPSGPSLRMRSLVWPSIQEPALANDLALQRVGSEIQSSKWSSKNL